MAEPSGVLGGFRGRTGYRVPHPLECLTISVSTVCSLACRFCAYRRSRIPRQIMPVPRFRSWLDRAVRFGYRTFNLSPLVGEPLLDSTLADKLVLMEDHPEVKYCFFSSNLTRTENGFFATLPKLGKLRWFSISLYGLNLRDFRQMTGGTENDYAAVLTNLRRLLEVKSLAGRCEVKVRGPGPGGSTTPQSECLDILTRLRDHGVQIRQGVRYMNWGGLVAKRDVAGLDLDFKETERRRALPCVFLFHKPALLPDGTVNACSCGDGNAELAIGHLDTEDFADIFSSSNPRYLGILHAHLAGRFPGPCRGCSGYRPVGQDWYSYRYHDREFIPLRGFFEWLTDRGRPA